MMSKFLPVQDSISKYEKRYLVVGLLFLVLFHNPGMYANDLKLTADKLIKSRWYAEKYKDFEGSKFERITFSKNKSVEFFWHGFEASGSLTGSYLVKDGQLQISDIVYKAGDGGVHLPESFTCKLQPVADSLDYAEKLHCSPDSFEIFNVSAKVPNGAPRNIGTIPVVVHVKKMKVTSTLKVRKGPSINGELLEWDGEGGIKRSNLSKGTQIQVFARTREKDKVQKWSNYWYYIKVLSVHPEKAVSAELDGWVFGEFLK